MWPDGKVSLQGTSDKCVYTLLLPINPCNHFDSLGMLSCCFMLQKISVFFRGTAVIKPLHNACRGLWNMLLRKEKKNSIWGLFILLQMSGDLKMISFSIPPLNLCLSHRHKLWTSHFIFPSMTLNVSLCNEAKDLFLQTLVKEMMHRNGYFWHIPPADSGGTVRQ